MAEANIRAVITAEDRASTTLNGFAHNVESGGQKMSAAFKAVSVAAAAAAATVGVALVKNFDDAIKRVDTLNNSARTFENMGFSTKSVDKAMKALDMSIRGLPTSLDSAVRGMTLISSAINDVEKSQKVFTALNNAILGFGGTTDMVSNAVTQLSQDMAGGKIMAQTWLSLVNSGLGPALAAMARDMGMTTLDLKEGLSEGTISVEQFTNKLIEMDVKGGGGMKSFQKIAKDSTDGIQSSWANMNTAITRGIASILNSIGRNNIANAITSVGKAFETGLKTVPILLAKLSELAKTVGEYLGPKLEALWNSITTKLIPALQNLWQNVILPLIPVIGTALVVAFGLAVDAINLIIAVLSPLINWISQNEGVVLALIGAIGTWYALMKVKEAFDFITSSVGTVIGALQNMIGHVGGAQGAFTNLNSYLAGFTGFAIIAAAAVAAAVIIMNEANKALAAWDAANASIEKNARIEEDATRRLQELVKTGDPGQQERAKRSLEAIAQNRRALGGPVSSNQSYLVGEKGPELFTPNRSGSIIPNNELGNVKQSDKLNISFNVNIGMFAGSPMERRNIARTLFKDFQDVASQYGVTPSSLLDGANGVIIR